MVLEVVASVGAGVGVAPVQAIRVIRIATVGRGTGVSAFQGSPLRYCPSSILQPACSRFLPVTVSSLHLFRLAAMGASE